MLKLFNSFDLFLIFIMFFFSTRALIRGFIREFIGVMGLIISLTVTILFYYSIVNFLRQFISIVSPWSEMFIIFFTFFLVFGFYLWNVKKLVYFIRIGSFFLLDRILGVCVGLIKGILFSYLVINLLSMVILLGTYTNLKFVFNNLINHSRVAPYIIYAGRYIIDLLPFDINRKIYELINLLKQYFSTFCLN